MKHRKLFALIALVLVVSFALAACASQAGTPEPDAEEAAEEETMEDGLSGDVIVDGSSTVYPITTAVAEEFAALAPDVRVSVGLSGTGGGFKKFCPGETDISDASRPIKDSEAEDCAANGVEWTEYYVAIDALTVMVNPGNDWLEELTPEQLAELLKADSKIVTWADLDPSYPDEEILFFIPDPDSGTRDYMIEVVEDVSGAEDLRQDANTTFSSDDNVLLDGIANELYAFGFFGFSYYINNADSVKAVAIVNPDTGEAVLPSNETAQDGSYSPLARPLFIYANNEATRTKPQVAAFLEYYFAEGAALVMGDVGYSMPPEGTMEANLDALNDVLAQ